ncbi:MAG TPA: hypothetical protein VK610_05780, partial [Rhodothermales bacterium]|nr:hypothetical protein [Rhodothermales bacterium]
NPARGPVAVRLVLPAPASAFVAVYDALGRRVAVLHDGPLAAGPAALALDAGRLVPGVYVVRATVGAARASAPLVIR